SPPFAFPATAVEGDTVAFLENEGGENGCDANGDGDTGDGILRAVTLAGGERSAAVLPPRAVDGAPLINGRSLAVSAGLVFFRSAEAAMARQQLTSLPLAEDAAVSGDGRVVAFTSASAGLVAGDSNGLRDVFALERATGAVTRVSVQSGGAQASGGTRGGSRPALSADGRYVAFQADFTDLVPGDGNGLADVFIHDRVSRVTERVSLSTLGGEADAAPTADAPAISADGRFVAFVSPASTLVADDANGFADVFLRDRAAGSTERVSLAYDGSEGDGDAAGPLAMTPDASLIAFTSLASILAREYDANGLPDVYLRDRPNGAVERISIGPFNNDPNGASGGASISADGRWVAFQTLATNLGGDALLLHDRQAAYRTARPVGACPPDCSAAQSTALSADGRFLAADLGAQTLLFDRQLATRQTIPGGGAPPSLSADGAVVVAGGAVRGLDGADPLAADALFADGQLDDVVLEVLDSAAPAPTARTLCPAAQVAVAAGNAAFLRP
ncbi:MAG: TolB family protein, partial [Candidatus Binatia bacterium]